MKILEAAILIGPLWICIAFSARTIFFAQEGLILPFPYVYDTAQFTINSIKLISGSPITKFINRVPTTICPNYILPPNIQRADLVQRTFLTDDAFLIIKTAEKILVIDFQDCTVLYEQAGNYEYSWQITVGYDQAGFLSIWNPLASERAYVVDLSIGCLYLDPDNQVAREYSFYTSDPSKRVTIYQEKNSQATIYEIDSGCHFPLSLTSVITTAFLDTPEDGHFHYLGFQNGKVSSRHFGDILVDQGFPLRTFLMFQYGLNQIYVYSRNKVYYYRSYAVPPGKSISIDEEVMGAGLCVLDTPTFDNDFLVGTIGAGMYGPECHLSCKAGCFGMTSSDCCASGCKSCKSVTPNDCINCLPYHFQSLKSCIHCHPRCATCENESKCSTCKTSNS